MLRREAKDPTVARHSWKCEKCGKPLPRSGLVWTSRYQKWLRRNAPTSGMYCDYCADQHECGGEY